MFQKMFLKSGYLEETKTPKRSFLKKEPAAEKSDVVLPPAAISSTEVICLAEEEDEVMIAKTHAIISSKKGVTVEANQSPRLLALPLSPEPTPPEASPKIKSATHSCV